MNSRQRQRRSSLVLVFVIGAALILLVLALAFAGGGGGVVPPQNNDRSAPAPVHNRVSTALGSDDKQALYDELSPSMKQLLPPDAFSTQSSSGSVSVQTLEAPQIKVGAPWNGEWADARARVTHDGIVEEYVVRYHLENGEWWLYATLKVK